MSKDRTSASPARPYHWRLLAILVGAILISVILVTPYSLSLQEEALKAAPLPIPLHILLPIQWLQTTILYGALAGIGLLIAARIGLGLPLLESWLAGRPDWALARKFVLPAIVAGLLVGIAILALDMAVFAPRVSAQMEALGLRVPDSLALSPTA